MLKESIEFEAYKVHQHNPILSDIDCWNKSERNLAIFNGDIHQVVAGTYLTCTKAAGIFGLFCLGYIRWEPCRELFENDVHTLWTKGQDKNELLDCSYFLFWFLHETDCCAAVANFIRETEHKLNLVHLTKFQKTNVTNCIKITPSDFWKKETMRLSLLTILCRAGIYYDSNNYDWCLQNNEYARETISAINAFLSGRTHFTGVHNYSERKNWHYKFSHNSNTSLLVAE